ncbi:MAG: ATP-binding cassette domain-containing protein [Actinomycetota bacterium]
MTVLHGPAGASPAPTIEAAGITKSFGHIEALRGATMSAFPGEVLALIGDNGAGKSTFSSVIAGVHVPDGGTIKVNGTEASIDSVRRARDLGIEIVYQDLAQAPDLTVVQNFFLGRELTRPGLAGRLGRVDEREMRARTAEALANLGARVPSLSAPISALSGGQRQAVAVARAVMWAKAAIIMDEPTAALGARQTAMVYDAVRKAAERGLAVILVSHDIPKMLEFSDRIAVMRHGRVVAQMPSEGLRLMDVLTTMLTAEGDAA